MPIYQGTSTKNKSETVINGQQMQKVYVGDRLVWQKPSAGIFYPEYGLLYNSNAITDSRLITSSNDFIIPTDVNMQTLANYLGASNNYTTNTVGSKLKEAGLTYWLTPNTNADNSASFNARGAEYRQDNGNFGTLKTTGRFWTSTVYTSTTKRAWFLSRSNEIFLRSSQNNKYALSLRLLYTGAGTPTSYTGNDGKIYRIIQIGTQYWLADNLSETRFRNGDIIPWYGANAANYFTNAEWAALTTAGCCAYNNTLSNVATGFTFPT